jgi:hypothetical protein
MARNREHLNEGARKWLHDRRDNFFRDKQCEWCGAHDNLELHHLDPSNKIANAIWSWTKEKRDIEIAKCIVLCRFCHRNYHYDLSRTKEHGATMYRNGCRCEVCRHTQTERMRTYRNLSGKI